MKKTWKQIVQESVKVASGFSGSLSMTRIIGRALSDKELRRPVVMLLPMMNQFEMVVEGEVDFAWCIPAKEAAWAMEGRGPGRTQALPSLRAVATFPQDDRIMIALSPDAPVSSLEEIAEKRPKLRVGVRQHEETSYGYFEDKIFQAYGFSLADIVSWGGSHHSIGTSWEQGLAELQKGQLDLAIGEASTQGIWKVMAARGYRFLGLRKDVVEKLVREEGFDRNLIPAGFLPGIDQPLLSIDVSTFMLCTTLEQPDDLVYTVTKVIDSHKKGIEEACMRAVYLYREALPIPQLTMTSPMTGPILRQWEAPIPLHPGAERYYREKGYLK